MERTMAPAKNLRQQLWASEPTSCSNDICGRKIRRGDECFADVLSDADYCQQCGVMLRYHRKKAGERNDPLPVTFKDIGKRNTP